MAPSITTSLLLFAALLGACSDGGLGSCGKQADLTGRWTLSLTMFDGDAGVRGDVVPRGDTIVADLVQVKSSGILGLGHGVWGTLTSQDKGFFDALMIPQLTKNNGSKTGAELSCSVKINVPIATPVSDDNTDQGPLRIALAGSIVQAGMMQGDPAVSMVIMSEDTTMTPRHFAWTASQ